MGARLDTKKEHQATRELWEVSLHGGRGSFSWLPVPNTICLAGSLLGRKQSVLKTEFLRIS